MARATAEILTQLRKLLPGHYESAEALLAGFAAAQGLTESTIDTLRDLSTVELGTGMWLTLHAHGLGIKRATGESDESLRIRLRAVEDQLTKPAIKAAVDRLIAPDECQIIEWYDQPYLDSETDEGAWLDCSGCWLSGGPRSFLVVIPRQETGFSWGNSYLDSDLYLDIEAYLADGPEDPVYAAIINEVERIRAAGVFWRLVLEE